MPESVANCIDSHTLLLAWLVTTAFGRVYAQREGKISSHFV